MVKEVFVLTVGYQNDPNCNCTELHDSIDKAEKSGNEWLEHCRQFGDDTNGYYRIDRYGFNALITEVKL